MKSIFTLWSLMILLTYQSLKGQGFSPELQSRFQHIIDSFQNNPANPYVGGMAVAVKVDRLAEWQGATGYAARNIDAQNNLLPGGTAFSVSNLSRIYSVTKTFTASLTLELANAGVFNLDDQIIKYLPLLGAVNPGLNTSVTIRQLLAHESGYSDYTSEIQLQIAVAFDPTHVWTPYEMVSFVHQISVPGTERRYSSTNYILLGAIIEAATGKQVEQYFRERFFSPLGLTSMYLDGRESIGNRGVLAAPHDNISIFDPIFQLTGQPTFPDTYTNISRFPLTGVVSLAFTGGGIVSNITDLAEWGNDLYSGKATDQSTLNTMLQSISSSPDEDGDRLGYGIILSNKISGNYDFIGHDGNAPGYRSILFYQPQKKLTLALMTNYHGANLYDVAKKIYEALPDYLCGNNDQDEQKIQLCFNGNTLCVSKSSAENFIRKGAYLGTCLQSSKVENDASMFNGNSVTTFPNPFTSSTTISFKSTVAGFASLKIYDLNGKLVANVYSGNAQSKVINKINFDGSRLPAGIYISRLQTATGITEQKIIKTR